MEILPESDEILSKVLSESSEPIFIVILLGDSVNLDSLIFSFKSLCSFSMFRFVRLDDRVACVTKHHTPIASCFRFPPQLSEKVFGCTTWCCIECVCVFYLPLQSLVQEAALGNLKNEQKNAQIGPFLGLLREFESISGAI